ncbi:MAG: hypothetical protein ACYS8W_00725 [Planctomycetota bacterium]|jgi:hypothetical protein
MVEFGAPPPFERYKPNYKKASEVRNSIIGCGIVIAVIATIAGFILYSVIGSAEGGIGEVVSAMEASMPADSDGAVIYRHLDALKKLEEDSLLSENDIDLLRQNYDSLRSDGKFSKDDVKVLDGHICMVFDAHGIAYEPLPSAYSQRSVYRPPPIAPTYNPPSRPRSRPQRSRMNTMRDNTRGQMNSAQDTRAKPPSNSPRQTPPKPKPKPRRPVIRRG